MKQLSLPFRHGTKQLSQVPLVFDCLRWILEGGYRRHRELLERHFPHPPKRLLDCGCGTGTYSNFFPSHAYVGIDVSPIYIARAQACLPKHCFRVMDATQLEFPDNHFDAAIISGVLHHLDTTETQRVLKEISRVLQPNGKLLVWEDVPTRNAFNLVGKIIHRLDVGEYIRQDSEYKELISGRFRVESTESFRSGFMDYTAFQTRNGPKHKASVEIRNPAGAVMDHEFAR